MYSSDYIEQEQDDEDFHSSANKYEEDTDESNSDIELRSSSEEDLENIDINVLEEDALSSEATRSEFLDNHENGLGKRKTAFKAAQIGGAKEVQAKYRPGDSSPMLLYQ